MEYMREVSPLERIFLRAPYSIVTMVARIKGEVTGDMVRGAVYKVQKRHPNLRTRIESDQEGAAWFTSQGVEEISIEVVERGEDNTWIHAFDQACKTPFEFDKRPGIRFILVQSPAVSELIIFCHHLICDGLSLAYLARDIMGHMGDPDKEAEILPDPIPIDKNNLPTGVSQSSIVNYFIERINRKWEEEKIIFDQEDYQNLNRTYWSNYRHKMIVIEFSEDETTRLASRCNNENVTINSALSTAILAAQTAVLGEKPVQSKLAVAGNLRDRLKVPAGEGMGFYAGAVNLQYKYNKKIGFWDNARKFHQKIQPLYNNRELFKDLLAWVYLSPGILESLSYKMIGGMVPPESPRHDKLSSFSKRNDVISSMLKREKMDSLDKVLTGAAVTNLTRMDFPRQYGNLELDRLIMNPGGAYPLVFINLVLGAVTCSGKLSLVIEYVKESLDPGTAEKIKDKTIEYLMIEDNITL